MRQSVLIFIVLHSWGQIQRPKDEMTPRVMFRVPPDLSCSVPEDFRTKHNSLNLVGVKENGHTDLMSVRGADI